MYILVIMNEGKTVDVRKYQFESRAIQDFSFMYVIMLVSFPYCLKDGRIGIMQRILSKTLFLLISLFIDWLVANESIRDGGDIDSIKHTKQHKEITV